MFISGIADEAGFNIEDQILATKELGWKWIESRNINGKNIVELDEADFDHALEKLSEAGIGINCFATPIMNWQTQVTDDFQLTLDYVAKTISRMHKAGSKHVRIMSHAVLKDAAVDDDGQMAAERFRRVAEVKKRFDDAGITPVHENCMNYGGMSYEHTLRLLEAVPGLRLVYDTGNPVFNGDYSKEEIADGVLPRQDAFEFYKEVKDSIEHIHIKDGIWSLEEGKINFTYPGDGQGYVEEICKDLLDRGYDGGFSMEPHVAKVFHEDGEPNWPAIRESYIKYGRQFEAILEKIGHAVSA